MMRTVRRDRPTRTVTFLFTDVEGSKRLLHGLGAERYAAVLAEHRGFVREAFAAEGGVEVDTQGDAFFVAFPTAPGALRAVEAILAGPACGPQLHQDRIRQPDPCARGALPSSRGDAAERGHVLTSEQILVLTVLISRAELCRFGA
jgi:class 3 adenylate cyclase